MPLTDSTHPSKQAIVNTHSYRITLLCKKSQNKITTAEHAETPVADVVTKGISFKCPLCNQSMVYLASHNKLSGHGLTDNSIGHELKKVQVVETIHGA